jgi:ferric-dicitrate binding protein FerR (iron transport regulator)
METTVTQELLFAHFEGRTTPIQRQQLREWLAEPANQERYYTWLQTWELQQPQFLADAEAGFRRFQRAAQTRPAVAPAPALAPTRTGHWRKTWQLAASVASLMGLGWLTQPAWNARTIATEFGEVRSVVLPDGSRVTLNANSTLTLPRFGFGEATRQVRLKGEADFAIQHTPSHQRFVVRTADGVEVVVLGTEFMVNTRRGTQVLLNRGRVQLRYGTGGQRGNATARTLTMHPGEWANIRDGRLLKRGQTATPLTPADSWKNYRYAFKQTTITEVAHLLEDNFGLRVRVSPALAERAVTGNFHARTADELLSALSELFGISVEQQGRVVTLTPAHEDLDD